MKSEKRTRKNLASPVLFSVGLLVAAGMAGSLDYTSKVNSHSQFEEFVGDEFSPLPAAGKRPLTKDDMLAAEVAWVYLQKNIRKETGLVDSVAGFPSTTLWDQGSYILGLVSAHRLGLVEFDDFHDRLTRLLDTLERLPLVDGKLPNKTYDTRTLTMTDYQNNPVSGGIGWSSLDIARLLVALRILERNQPSFGARINSVIAQWSLEDLSRNGELMSGSTEGGELKYFQEGRIGYEQYGARSTAMWGVDVNQAISARRILDWRTINGTKVPTDLRTFEGFQAITPTLSEPYFLIGLEFGFGSESQILASQVYKAQVARSLELGILTMVSEDHVNQEPHFLYSSVFSNGRAWAVVDEDGNLYPSLRTESVKSVYAWDALFSTEYTKNARQEVLHLANAQKGWAAGYFEEDGSANDIYSLNTNAIVLEAIHYMSKGSLWGVN